MYKRIIQILFLLFIILLLIGTSACAETYRGKVIDADTNEPIKGVVIVRSWDRETAGPAGSVSSFIGMKETLTDEKGQFILHGKLYFPGIPLLTWVFENKPIFFKPGYKFLILDESTSVVKMESIPATYYMRYEEVQKARGNYEVDFYVTKLFKESIPLLVEIL